MIFGKNLRRLVLSMVRISAKTSFIFCHVSLGEYQYGVLIWSKHPWLPHCISKPIYRTWQYSRCTTTTLKAGALHNLRSIRTSPGRVNFCLEQRKVSVDAGDMKRERAKSLQLTFCACLSSSSTREICNEIVRQRVRAEPDMDLTHGG